VYAATPENARVCSSKSKYSGGETQNLLKFSVGN
jgi:hypothetical protein